ncbi:hypothetical protein ACFOHT_04810 [Massilia oculi]|uniref:Uncharacterized protein n=1 Tax=Massilia oculi TaxID=945844 RepID=A0A2S2DDG4_9BURK|nr:MarR family winged helix-turn-helix transcriptional regulator [Massilia oculi]AWL03391.1 hypothetical protein DIR46_02270 [Massilia oculi]
MNIPKFLPPTVQERVEEHIKKRPGIMTRELVDELEITAGSATMAVNRLQVQGKIHRINLLNERRAKWGAGPAPDFDPDNPTPGIGQPKQRTVKDWERKPVPRDPLLWALYGAQP